MSLLDRAREFASPGFSRVGHPVDHVLTGGVGHNPPQEAPRAFADSVVEVDRL